MLHAIAVLSINPHLFPFPSLYVKKEVKRTWDDEDANVLQGLLPCPSAVQLRRRRMDRGIEAMGPSSSWEEKAPEVTCEGSRDSNRRWISANGGRWAGSHLRHSANNVDISNPHPVGVCRLSSPDNTPLAISKGSRPSKGSLRERHSKMMTPKEYTSDANRAVTQAPESCPRLVLIDAGNDFDEAKTGWPGKHSGAAHNSVAGPRFTPFRKSVIFATKFLSIRMFAASTCS